jgi:hypothetical protein
MGASPGIKVRFSRELQTTIPTKNLFAIIHYEFVIGNRKQRKLIIWRGGPIMQRYSRIELLDWHTAVLQETSVLVQVGLLHDVRMQFGFADLG